MWTHTGFEVACKTKHNNAELQIEEKSAKKGGKDGYSRPSADVIIILETQN